MNYNYEYRLIVDRCSLFHKEYIAYVQNNESNVVWLHVMGLIETRDMTK